MNKPLAGQVLLTSEDIYRWQSELSDAEKVKADAEAIIADRRKKLDYAAFLSGTSLPQGGEQESFNAGVKRLLAMFGRDVAHHELQAELRKVPHFRATLDKNKGAYYYTVIKRLAGGKNPSIKKVGKKIRLIHKTETPPEGNPEGAS